VNLCLNIVVKGRVQGVAFRANTRKWAIKLGIQGYVRNLNNGDVEILACGKEEALQELVAWCHEGPRLAKVSEVLVTEQKSQNIFDDFQIL